MLEIRAVFIFSYENGKNNKLCAARAGDVSQTVLSLLWHLLVNRDRAPRPFCLRETRYRRAREVGAQFELVGGHGYLE